MAEVEIAREASAGGGSQADTHAATSAMPTHVHAVRNLCESDVLGSSLHLHAGGLLSEGKCAPAAASALQPCQQLVRRLLGHLLLKFVLKGWPIHRFFH